MNVRRLAAVDMHGTRGTARRRRIILAEFLVGVVAMVALGIWLLASSSSLGSRAIGLWFTGAGLNYAPLSIHALALMRPGALDAELTGVDIDRERRRYTVLQLWVFVPLALVVFGIRDALARRRAAR
ncbi:hypothetical protein HNR22_000525 [Micromonospora jinlongensis]|uniref:Uncharacterized protein n=1 Tax=Micromonospora jinlongensis TaxID=1287877 RepID=A0A7Z0BB38_9ACTN|nr:hypothetical protein [Micromonospora jinlongensis]NYH40798.1 hypothetical protein [Micromonospora jinlongensis]